MLFQFCNQCPGAAQDLRIDGTAERDHQAPSPTGRIWAASKYSAAFSMVIPPFYPNSLGSNLLAVSTARQSITAKMIQPVTVRNWG